MEGDDDERFFKKTIKTELEKKYYPAKLFKYAGTPRFQLEQFIIYLNKSNIAYIFLSDMDRTLCYTKKKERIKSKTAKNVDTSKIAIVKAEIESWHLAGLDYGSSKSLGIQYNNDTEHITKEDFDKMNKKYSSRIDFMMDILEKFSIDTAKTQNKSFRYFCDKFL